jgi:stage II sporulation SpoE-like protein/GAF domain-containing protein/PAS domain-containing protein
MPAESGRVSTELLRLALDNLADSVTIHDAEGRLVYVNEATRALMQNQSVEEIVEAEPGSWTERFAMYHEDGRPVELSELPGRRLFEEGEGGELLIRRVERATGATLWVRIKAEPLRDDDGRIIAAVNVSEDVTEVKEAEQAAQLLADAGAALATSLDYERTLQHVAQLAVPEFADWCGVDLVGSHGEIESVAIAHAEPDKVALGRKLRREYPTSPDDEGGLAEVLRSGTSELIQEIPDELLVEAAQSEEHLRLLRAIGLHSVLIVPLLFGDRVLGAMSFVLGPPRRFDEADVSVAEELARRAVTAIENSRLFTERGVIASTLQEGLLPPTLATPPGFDTAVLFRAAGTANEVGGDFYDVIQVGGDWMAFIGDVAGKGAAAAALTARARYTMISVAQLTGSVDDALGQVNDALVGLPGLPLCTLACVTLAGDKVGVLSAGHPLPYRLSSEAAAPIGRPGPLLGLDPRATWPRERLSLEPGESIVLYSDGVLDTMGRERERYGERRFDRLLQEGRGDSATELVERIDAALLEFEESEQRDDVAVLVLERQD